MPTREYDAVWLRRQQDITPQFRRVRLPNQVADDVSQDAEFCYVEFADTERRVRFHDYDEVYAVPGLYEEIFYRRLRCCSPARVSQLLGDVLADEDESFADLRVLDVGAGNGMVGDELAARGTRHIVGIDIIQAAKTAAYRDRPEVYDDYFVADLTELREPAEKRLREHRFNCLTTVAALGFGDIPPRAFLKALDIVNTPAWLAFNIKEDFLDGGDDSGFSSLIRKLDREDIIRIEAFRRYPHRLSITGDKLHYVAMVARKMCDVPDELLEQH